MEKVRAVYISNDCDDRLSDWLGQEGYRVIRICTSGLVAEPVSDHPDMFMCRLGFSDDAMIIMYPELERLVAASGPDSAVRFTRDPARTLDPDKTILRPDYPYDIAYNAACTGRYFIHNLRYTASELIEAAKAAGMQMVNVKQGYSKCSTVIVDEQSVITYDQGIAAACRYAGMDVLIVEPGHVLLPGYNTGFIGGASGRLGGTIIFNGDLSSHPDFEAITGFIRSRGLELKLFDEWPLTDTGSII